MSAVLISINLSEQLLSGEVKLRALKEAMSSIIKGSRASLAIGVRAGTKAAKIGIGSIVPTKELGGRGYFATINVLPPTNAAAQPKMGHKQETWFTPNEILQQCPQSAKIPNGKIFIRIPHRIPASSDHVSC